MIEADKEIDIGIGTYRITDDGTGPDVYFSLPWVNGTDLRLHFIWEQKGFCISGIPQWAMDSDSDFLFLSEDSDIEEAYGIDCEEIEEMVARLAPFAEELLKEFVQQGGGNNGHEMPD